MKEKIIAFIATVKERELQLKIVLSQIYDQVDKIHLVLNWYEEIPEWIKNKERIYAYLNPENKNAHDAIWSRLEEIEAIDNVIASAEKYKKPECYYFILDDDLLYPADYVEKLIAAIERHERRAVITVHGTNFSRPVESYCKSRTSYTFSDVLERDIFVDMTGCGTTAFHSSTVKPTLQNFPIPFNRDLYFSILCARQNIKIVSIQRQQGWILPLKTSGETVFDTTAKSKNLQLVKERLLKEALIPLLYPNSSHIDGEEL